MTPMTKVNKKALTIALPKGRIMKESVALFEAAGFDVPDLFGNTRKLIFENKDKSLRFMIVRGQDVPTYVEHGAADLGVAGKDVLVEQDRDLYEPLELGIGKCRMVVAEPKEVSVEDDPTKWTHITVATKFEKITKEYFGKRGVQVDMIKLYGSIELAPLLGLSERIVDLVETGETLKKNGLVEVDTIMEISSRLVCNRASLKTKSTEIRELIDKLSIVVKDNE